MGRYIKNKELRSGSYSIRLPVGSNVTGPNAPVDGLVRYNSARDEMEIYIGSYWRTVKTLLASSKEPVKDTFYGDGVKRVFGPLKYKYGVGQELMILVFVGNVFQNPGVAYSLNDDNIQFSSTPPDGQAIVVIHGLVG